MIRDRDLKIVAMHLLGERKFLNESSLNFRVWKAMEINDLDLNLPQIHRFTSTNLKILGKINKNTKFEFALAQQPLIR